MQGRKGEIKYKLMRRTGVGGGGGGRKEKARDGPRGVYATVKSLWLPSVSLRSVWENGSLVRLCVFVHDVGAAALLCCVWLSSLSGEASLLLLIFFILLLSLCGRRAGVPVPRKTLVSLESPFHTLSLYQTPSLSFTREAVYIVVL